MQSFLNKAKSWISNIGNIPPDQVREEESTEYAKYRIQDRDEAMMLYGPIPQPKQKNDKETPADIYSIVVHNQSSRHSSVVISVYRSSSLEEANQRFNLYKQIIPLFLEAKMDLFSAQSLQRICDASRANEDWSVCHISVYLDLTDTLRHEKFSTLINKGTKDSITPLLMAIKSGSKHITQAVLAAGGSLEVKDTSGNNAFHLAATGPTIQLIDIIASSIMDKTESLKSLINERNNDNNTPLHLACLADNQDAVLALLNNGADLNTMGKNGAGASGDITVTSDKDFRTILKQFPNQLYVKDIKHGGTPLHWAMEKPIMDAFLELGCDILSKDFHGNSALHSMIKHKRFTCVVCLLSHGADVHERDGGGNLPIHLAAVSGDINILKALLIFGGDYSSVNSSGQTAWDLILTTHQSKLLNNMDKERNMLLYTLYQLGARGPASLEQNKKEFDWKPKVTEDDQIFRRSRHMLDSFLDRNGLNVKESIPGGLRILSLDGGGIRGLVLTKILAELQLSSKVNITDIFDWIGGTSTGGILTLALACGKSPAECQGLYFRLKDKVFVGRRPYDEAPFESFLKRELGENITMASLPEKPKLTVTGTMADRFPAEQHLFTNYIRPADILGLREQLPQGVSPAKKPDEQEVWRAARCSGAAPTYFRSAGRFIDGGLIGNNPTLDILTEIHERNCALRAVGREKETDTIGLVVSCGTGEPPLERVESCDLFVPESIMNIPQLVYGASSMGRLLVEQACSASNRVVDRARAWCSMAGISYVRLSPQLDSDVAMNETDDKILVNMIYLTQVYMYENRIKIDALVKQLLTPASK